jgi:hypothetical protein
MGVLTTIANSKKAIREMKGEEIVIVPFPRYEALLQELEDLRDIHDHYKAIEDHRKGKGRVFREFVAEHKDEFGL